MLNLLVCFLMGHSVEMKTIPSSASSASLTRVKSYSLRKYWFLACHRQKIGLVYFWNEVVIYQVLLLELFQKIQKLVWEPKAG